MLGRRARVVVAALGLVAGSLGVVAAPFARAAAVPAPKVSEPPAGIRGHALWDSWYELEPFGYQEQEYFLSGTARDATGNTAPYTTRIIVTRPKDPKAFNGTALLDWVNVTAQFENAVDTMETRPLLMREGFMYVHVSAQAAGVCCSPLTPKVWDPVRYAALDHPGDAFANDMFSQVAQALRAPRPGGIDPTGDLTVRRVVAAGQSQSCGRLFGYIDDAHPAARVIDGFLVHGCRASNKRFRTPLSVPVIHLLSDAEAHPSAASTDPRYRLWEVAGTAHSDFFIGYQSVVGMGPRVLAGAAPRDRAGFDQVMRDAGNYGEQLHPMHATCVVAGSTMPMRYVASSALSQLDRWVRTTAGEGTFVPRRDTPRFAFDGEERRVDADGNTVGGIRMPPIDVPVARYESTACPLGGITVPFTDLEIQARYPTHQRYLALMRARTDVAVRGGWLLPADALDLMRRACDARSRWGQLGYAACPTYTPPTPAT